MEREGAQSCPHEELLVSQLGFRGIPQRKASDDHLPCDHTCNTLVAVQVQCCRYTRSREPERRQLKVVRYHSIDLVVGIGENGNGWECCRCILASSVDMDITFPSNKQTNQK